MGVGLEGCQGVTDMTSRTAREEKEEEMNMDEKNKAWEEVGDRGRPAFQHTCPPAAIFSFFRREVSVMERNLVLGRVQEMRGKHDHKERLGT